MIINWAIVVLTFGLLIITYLYMQNTKRLADDTKRMADAVVKEYELKIRPLIEFKLEPKYEKRPSRGEGLKINVEIFNLGEIPINVSDFILTWWFNNHPNHKHEIKYEIKNRVIYKERTYPEEFFYPRNKFETKEVKGNEFFRDSRLYQEIAGEFCIYYLDHDGNQQEKCKKRNRLI